MEYIEGMRICAVPAEDTERLLRKIKEMEAWDDSN